MSIPGTYESHLTLSGLQRVVLGAIPIPSSSWRNGLTNLLRKSWGSSLIVTSFKPTGSSNQQALVKETYWRWSLIWHLRFFEVWGCLYSFNIGFLGLRSQQHSIQAIVFGVALGQHLHGVWSEPDHQSMPVAHWWTRANIGHPKCHLLLVLFSMSSFIFADALCFASTSTISVSGHSRHAVGEGVGAWRDCSPFWACWRCRPWRNERLQSEAVSWQLHAHFRHWQHICHGHLGQFGLSLGLAQFGLSLGLAQYIAFRCLEIALGKPPWMD